MKASSFLILAGAAGAFALAVSSLATARGESNCGEQVELSDDNAVPAVVLGNNEDKLPRWSVMLTEDGHWSLILVQSRQLLCLVDEGDSFRMNVKELVPLQPKGDPL